MNAQKLLIFLGGGYSVKQVCCMGLFAGALVSAAMLGEKKKWQ